MASDADIVNPTEQQKLGSQKKVLEKVSKLFSEVLKGRKYTGLHYHAAHFLVKFILRVVSPKKKVITLEANPMLNFQLCLISDRLFNAGYNDHFHHDCQIIFSFIESAPGYNRENLTKALIERETFTNSRIYLLGLIYKTGKSCDTVLRDYLIKQTEKLAFNDNNKEAVNHAILFEPFYSTIDEKTYLDQMHSNTQFCVNRSGKLL
jgi:hypothetical protein